MKKIGKQLNFIKELDKADELEASLEPKEAMPSVADLNLDPEKLTSEIEQYLNEEPDLSNSSDSDLSSKISGSEIKHSVNKQSGVEKTDKEKAYWAQVYGKTPEKQAEYDRSAREHLAEIRSELEAKSKKQALGKNGLSEKPVSLIAEETEDFSLDSDFDSASTSDSDSEYESPYEELMPPSMRKENQEAALEKQKRAAEEEAREKKSREDDVRIRREQQDDPPKF